MKKEDLRIGNLVFAYGKEQIIDAVDFSVIDLYERKKEDHPYKPIFLTEEWCIRMRFNPADDGYYTLKVFEDMLLTWNIYDKELRFDGEEIIGGSTVHILQNVYYFLTDNYKQPSRLRQLFCAI